MARCKYCGQEILWIRTPEGKQMPCDTGLLAYKRRLKAKGRIVTKNGEVVPAVIGVNIGSADGLGYEPHWARCKGARRERQKEESEQLQLQIGDGGIDDENAGND